MPIGACNDCEFLSGSISVGGTESKVALTEDGNILYGEISPCGISMSKVGRDELATDYPDILRRIDECEGSVEETIEAPRAWPLGMLGLTKEVTIGRCGATSALELQEVVSASKTASVS